MIPTLQHRFSRYCIVSSKTPTLMEFVIFQNVNIYKDFLQPIGPERGEVFCIIFLCIWFVMCLYLHNASELFIPLWLIFMKRIDECMEFCCLFMRKILDSSFVRKYHCFVWNNKLVISLKKKSFVAYLEGKEMIGQSAP